MKAENEKLVKMLALRLDNEAAGPDGSVTTVFSEEQLEGFVEIARLEGHRGDGSILSHAFIRALQKQVLREVGKEFTINDNGVTVAPAPISDRLLQLIHIEQDMVQRLPYVAAPAASTTGSWTFHSVPATGVSGTTTGWCGTTGLTTTPSVLSSNRDDAQYDFAFN